MRRVPTWVFIIVALFIFGMAALAVFGLPSTDSANPYIAGTPNMRFGIDIRGGVDAVFEAEDETYKMTDDELTAALRIIEMRLDAKNILDRDVTIDKTGRRILVRFPWKSSETNFNPQQAILELGEMAHLTFRDPDNKVVIEGKNVKNAAASTEPGAGFIVNLELDSDGATAFAEATARLIGQPIGIFMDETLISAPKVESVIPNGKAMITQMESAEAASALADKINAGALPVKLVSRTNNSISPSLGKDALNVMSLAGMVAFALICLFMLLYYRLPGLVACIALIGQTAGMLLAISIPQITLTLPGIAGIILSIGMGVDANIIISERIAEEMSDGKSLRASIGAGYHKAFSAVADGNVTVAIAAIMLIVLGSGTVLSFGYSLLTGVILNTLMGVTASRLMTSALSGVAFLQKPWLFRVKKARV